MPEMLIWFVVGAVVGAALGFLVAWVRAARSATERRLDLETRLARAETERDAVKQESAEKLKLLDDAREKFEQTFKALAGDTLQANSESFLRMARVRMETLLLQADSNLKELLAPMSESLKRHEENLRRVEKDRAQSYGALNRQITDLLQAQHSLEKETGNLVNALRLPQVRGRWGEMTLRRTAELAGMARHCDFSEQLTVKDGRHRPDMVVHLPGGREIVVDAKVSLIAYLKAVECATEEERERHLTEHAKQVRAHMVGLAAKDYPGRLERAVDFTVLFLPAEAFFSTAVRHDPELLEDSMRRGVVLATPTTLMALLRAVAHGWRQAQLEDNARRISEAGRELYDRAAVLLGHLGKVGSALRQTVEHYNKATGSLNARFVPLARKFKELGATSAGDLPAVDPIDEAARVPEPHPDGPEAET